MVMIDLASRTRMRFEDTRSLSSPVFAPSGQSLVFSSDRDGEFGLWSRPLPGDGTRGGVRKLTRQRGDAEQCAISPDGLRVAYSRRFGARTDIWIVSTRGGPARRFTDDATIDLHPAWSRDGTRLAFVSDRDGRPHVWVAPAEGSAVPEDARQVTAGEGVDAHPVWIGDDDAIAFIRTSGADRDVWTVSLDELAPPRRLSFGAGARFVRWSAMDGALWVAATWGTGSVELRQLSIDDGAITPFSPPLILGPSTSVAYFDISDDGRHLAYVEREVSGDIWTLDADRGRF
jgi:TolB protein